MATYLLLRNNKESGPLSFDELVKMGIKPYDLVWVHGKSAAWRYPSEIPELIPYAPVVEEQPYDRFYQKSRETDPQKDESKPDRIIKASSNEPVIPKTNVVPDNFHSLQENERVNRETKVFVSLPDKKQVSRPDHKIHDQSTSLPNYSAERNPGIQKQTVHDLPEINRTSEKVPEGRPVELEEKFSQPLDDIKEMYVQTLNQRKKRNARKHFFTNTLKIAAAIVVVLAIGMMIGMYFNQDATNPNMVSKKVNDENTSSELNTAGFIPSSSQDDGNPEIESFPEKENFIDYPQQEVERQKQISDIKSNPPSSQDEQITYSGVAIDPQNNERKRVIRDDNTVAEEPKSYTKKTSIENIWDDVSISTSDFKTGPFGGIKDLQITLANKSSYPLDKVEIEVKYIGMEKQVVKTQKMVFNDVVAGGQVHADVPRTGRGMEVDVSIKKINVKDFSFANPDN
ncbi:MAG: DUF4339 domain-containing protein [Chitinophagaceae bacterium]|nr:DUF4339 domain-containing protein [Chitinophagaceae bacterium]